MFVTDMDKLHLDPFSSTRFPIKNPPFQKSKPFSNRIAMFDFAIEGFWHLIRAKASGDPREVGREIRGDPKSPRLAS